ncbi:MAG: hypothetical protein H0T76_26500 [Nannocystis sp.]|nr:hypothetical protein [Nannocystis sp.]
MRLKFPQFMTLRRSGWAFVRAVGHVVLPSGCVLRIRSAKAPAHALAAWLAYTDPSLRDIVLDRDIDAVTEEGEISGLLAAIYVQLLTRACMSSGVTRVYQPVQAVSPYIRGRIDFTRHAVRGHDWSKIPCTSWMRVPDSPLNCFLVAALERARRDPLVSTRLAGALAGASHLLAGIPARIEDSLLYGRAPLQRNEWPFQGAYRLARLILQNQRLGDGQRLPGFAFILNLERLFEKAVATAFARAGVDCKARAPVTYVERLSRTSGHRSMYLDLLCQTADGLLVVDAKFKHEVSAGNLQQMVTYCFLSGARRAWLILPGEPRESSTFCFNAPDGQSIIIETRFLATNAASLGAWEQNGAMLAGGLAASDALVSPP